MSAGDFIVVAYDANYATNEIHPVRLQPETLAAVFKLSDDPADDKVNDAPDDPISNPISALVSIGRKERGLRARFVTCRWTGTPPTGYSGRTFNLTVCRPATFNTLNIGTRVTYLGSDARVIAIEPERVR